MRFFCRFMGNWIRGRNNSPLNKQPSINNPKSPSYHYTIQCVLRNLYNIRLTVLSLNNTHSEAQRGIEPLYRRFADGRVTSSPLRRVILTYRFNYYTDAKYHSQRDNRSSNKS